MSGIGWLRALGLWALLAMLASLNGIAREKMLVPWLGPVWALRLSGIFLAAVIFIVAWIAVPWLRASSAAHYWAVGALWLIMTLLFEFLVGRYVAGKSWDELLQAYALSATNLWLLVLAVILTAPYLAAKFRGLV